MQCSKCHHEFSSTEHAYCPVCGTPVRHALPPLPPRQGINGCLLGCLISVVVLFVFSVVVPLILIILGSTVMGWTSLSDIVHDTTEQMKRELEHSQNTLECKYNLYGTLDNDKEIYLALEEPESSTYEGHLYISTPGEDYSEPCEISGSITENGEVSFAVTNPTTKHRQQWIGVAVTNPDGIVAIKGSIKESGEEFYVTRR